MKKDLEIGELNDIYGALLTPRQNEILKSYYDYDLSLSEIAENTGVTRQAVRDAIVKASEQLKFFEENVGALALKNRVKNSIEKICSDVKSGNADDVVASLDELVSQL